MVVELFRRYRRDERGQFAILFAVCATMLMMGVMVAVDMSKMTSAKTKVAAITDAAALAGAQSFDSPDRINVVKAFLEGNGSKMLPAKFSGEPSIDFDDISREVTVSVATRVDMPFASMFGFKDPDVAYKSVAVFPDNMDPLTIVFALDVSGSMGGMTTDGVVKMTALKSATNDMFDIIEGKVKNPQSIEKHIRTGVSAFNGALSVDQSLEWGFDETRTTINGLVQGGMTNTFAALDNAHQKILDDRMFRITADPGFNQNTLDEFVIFMTDGENTAGDPVLLDDDSYEKCIEMREDGIEVYAIGFAAPTRGQMLLLDCASWDDAVEDVKSKRAHNRKRGCKVIAGLAGFLPNVNILQVAFEKCKQKNHVDKKEHYYDAATAKSFEEIFRIIAEKINEDSVRIKS